MSTSGTGASTMVFGDLDISYDQSVLKPRPWTLLQSDWAVELDATAPSGRMLELCSGAGQIGLMALVRCDRSLLQVDLNPAACAFAELNASRVGVAARVEVRNADLRSLLGTAERFPIILADPPYLPSSDVARFADDPLVAIDGGGSGLDLLIDCLAVIRATLADGGTALVQLRGPGQLEALRPHVPAALTIGECRVHDAERAVVAFHLVPAGAPASSAPPSVPSTGPLT